MALSNALPNTVLKPGVCTSTTRPTAPYEGQFIYETDTDALLVYNGSSWITPSGPNSNPTSNNQFARKLYVDSLISTVSSNVTTAQNTANSAVSAAATAQSTANSANTNANGRMPIGGGTFTGAVNMGSNALYLRTGDPNHYIHYDVNIDGATVAGWSACRIYISSNGTSYDFKNNGTAIAPGQWYSSSSMRYKENIEPLESAVVSESIDKLEPIFFTYKNSQDNKKNIGFIAEHVAEIMPELVEYDEEGNPEAVAYSQFAVLAVAEIKELRKRVSEIERRLDALA
jgi:hypothetical protein